jgi:hypothetical protein
MRQLTRRNDTQAPSRFKELDSMHKKGCPGTSETRKRDAGLAGSEQCLPANVSREALVSDEGRISDHGVHPTRIGWHNRKEVGLPQGNSKAVLGQVCGGGGTCVCSYLHADDLVSLAATAGSQLHRGRLEEDSVPR